MTPYKIQNEAVNQVVTFLNGRKQLENLLTVDFSNADTLYFFLFSSFRLHSFIYKFKIYRENSENRHNRIDFRPCIPNWKRETDARYRRKFGLDRKKSMQLLFITYRLECFAFRSDLKQKLNK